MQCPDGETVVMPNSPIRMDSVGELRTVPAAKVGADTRQVLLDLGYTQEQIQAMEASGAVKAQN